MRQFLLTISIFLPLFLYGCYTAPQGKTDSLSQTMVNTGLPVEKLVIFSGDKHHMFDVEVANDDAQRKIGLMNRTSLDKNKGMLFIFQTEGYVNFWMKNTLIPLDMLFLDSRGYVKHIVHSAQPCTAASDSDCPKYNSEEKIKFVLELNGGIAKEYDIREGDKVSWL